MLIGIDLDNTIINYDKVFFSVAIKNKLVPKNISKNKISIKKYLFKKKLTKKWKVLQSEVYGKNISEAIPYKGILKVINELVEKKINFKIVSHKTKNPYVGKKLNLHKISKKWLKEKITKLCTKKLKKIEIYFETSQAAKIKRIKKLGCTHFIDDLQNILEKLPTNMTKILFLPNTKIKKQKNFLVINSWDELFKKIGIR